MAKALLNCSSLEHLEKSLLHLLVAVKQTIISFVQELAVLVFFAVFFFYLAMSLLMPAAVHDFSINGSYASDISSDVQFGTMPRHNLLAQMYLSPGSEGAFFKSLAEIVFLDDAPGVTDFIADAAGVPASAVPQYWHRAAGLEDRFIAHAESKHFVRFIREQGAAHPIWGITQRPNIKSANLFIIFSLKGYYTKKADVIKGKFYT